ncbi:MAG: hypothetical protein ACR2GU_12170 [Rubrobacteraceae bacterium]
MRRPLGKHHRDRLSRLAESPSFRRRRSPEVTASAKEVIITLRHNQKAFVEDLSFVTSVGGESGGGSRKSGTFQEYSLDARTSITASKHVGHVPERSF